MGLAGQRHAPSTLPPGKRHGTYSTGGWVGLRGRKNYCLDIYKLEAEGFLESCYFSTKVHGVREQE